MANNEVVADANLRDVIANWYFREYWNGSGSQRPDLVIYYDYYRTLANLAAADGVLADREREWILGNLLVKGGNEEMYNYFKTYTPTKADLEATINQRPSFTQIASRPLIFEAFMAASADAELHKDERDAIYRIGRMMGVEDAIIQRLEQAAVNEREHRRQLVNLVFPEGFQQACAVAVSDFQNNKA